MFSALLDPFDSLIKTRNDKTAITMSTINKQQRFNNAAREGRINNVREHLTDGTVDVNDKDYGGWTALHHACSKDEKKSTPLFEVSTLKTAEVEECVASTEVKAIRSNFDDASAALYRTDIDNHADRHCFGKNFRPLHWSNRMCNVSPFLPEYKPAENIEICTAATAWTNDHGKTFILVFGQGLWFGDRITISLVNPNQCRAFGISLCDDPTDTHRALGFHTDKVLIELFMKGTIATMMTHFPSQEELDTCPFIYLSDENSWDPKKVTFQTNSMMQESQAQLNQTVQKLTSDFESKIEALRSEICAGANQDNKLTSQITTISNTEVAKCVSNLSTILENLVDRFETHFATSMPTLYGLKEEVYTAIKTAGELLPSPGIQAIIENIHRETIWSELSVVSTDFYPYLIKGNDKAAMRLLHPDNRCTAQERTIWETPPHRQATACSKTLLIPCHILNNKKKNQQVIMQHWILAARIKM